MIRLVLVILSLVLFFIVTLPIYLVLLILKRWFPAAASKAGQAVVSAGFKVVLFAAGVKVEATGLENVPEEPVLFCANHRSLADIPVFYTTVPTRTGIVSKKEVKKVPFLSWWMSLLNCLFLDRSDVKQALKTILRGVDNIKNGSSMCIMPEGTRVHDEEMLPFKEGSFKMAEKTGCPVVPVAIWKSDEVFELHAPKVKGCTVKIHYCEPILVGELSKEEQKHIGILARERIAYEIRNMKND
ncbi:MAG: 1-acyl-sn-glycerol-3-phosphate acyltransferase [Lachnospiraceae bacterium]|nr:1-acyl-sn-glycerol-3-phosphate acyltransferase [Lachnospiraceae bacterium]MBP5185085.1 1-acyl-sn-glycerol-3-phosphate acyltransferase [Lachnospiraceae bacterium]